MERAAAGRLGPYVLVRRLGAGGMGEVWEAVLHGPAGFQKAVALKLLLAGPADADAQESLLREARLGALLQHPNVVGTLGLGEYDGTWCIALELVRGLSIGELLRASGGVLPPGAVLDIGVQAAAGLEHIHALAVGGWNAGLVHRDVKPANLLVDRTGLVKVADLGISTLVSQPGVVAGTPGYTPPEQAAGLAEARSDLFSLGTTLYLLATGVRPFGNAAGGSTSASRVEDMLRSEDFLARVESAVAGLGGVLWRCLRADPAHRYPSARDLMDALAGLRSRQPPGATLVQLLGAADPRLVVDPSPRPPPAPEEWLHIGGSASDVTDLPARGNLAAPRDRFVGRATELARLESHLADGHRFVVVVGPGGMGKTRLAVELARRHQALFPGGAWVFELAEAKDADGICAAVGDGLGIELDRGDAVMQLGRVLATKQRVLVVLDNLEQCIDGLPRTLERWLEVAPLATFLCTSRAATRLSGEQLVPLGALKPGDADALFQSRATRPLTEEERSQVGPLCTALEFMPLAIELCAARLGVMAVPAMRGRLGLGLLSGGGRERPRRQRSVEASLRWSWELLSEAGRLALGQLSVFDGGFQLEAAEAVLNLDGSAWALDVLQELVDASLLRVDPEGHRFRLPGVVREFGARLLGQAAVAAVEEAHGRHYAQLGMPEAVEAIDRKGALGRYHALVAERDNLLAGCRRAIARADGPTAVACLRGLAVVLSRAGPLALLGEVGAAVAALPSLTGRERALAEGLCGDALIFAGRPGDAEELYLAALAFHRKAGDRRMEGAVLSSLGQLRYYQGRLQDARTLMIEALGVHRETGSRRYEGISLGHLGILHKSEGRFPEAFAYYEAALEVHREVGNHRYEGNVLGNLGNLLLKQSRFSEAVRYYEASLAVQRQVADRRSEGIVLGNLVVVYLARGRLDAAQGLIQVALGIHRDVGDRRSEATALGNWGDLEFAQGHLDEALIQYQAALRLNREVANHYSEAIVLGALGSLHLAMGEFDLARKEIEEANAVARAHGDPHVIGVVMVQWGILEHRTAHFSAARAAFVEAERIFRELGSLADLADSLCCIALLDADERRLGSATALLSQATALADELGAGPESKLGRRLSELRMVLDAHG